VPDGSPQQEAAALPAAAEPTVGGIVRDEIDVRDRHYEPTLARLAPRLDPPEELLKTLRDGHNPWGLPRWQGEEGTCGGQALAALIDIERIRAGVRRKYKVSARMIYETARLKSGDAGEGVSLRDVIKAFYNYGVCADSLWRYIPGDPQGALDGKRADDARAVSLGAYYRLRPNLNTYHAALHETGALLVSAELHDGWTHDAVATGRTGVIELPRDAWGGDLAGDAHAFVIVGYTPEGFLVLNSWGNTWGHWRPETPRNAPAVPGVALWRYEDWADRIMDGWVLRLGAGAAASFDYSIGDQGLGFGVDRAARSTPVHAILGSFMHLDDGAYVEAGTYVSTRSTLQETKRHLIDSAGGGKPYRGALLTFAGGLLGLREAAENVARCKKPVSDAGWFPFTVLWCVDYVEQARAVLDGVFKEALERAGSAGPRLDRVIEERAHGVGRAFWRDIARAADTAAAKDGPLHDLVRAACDLAPLPGFRLRIAAESEGVFALIALLRAMKTRAYREQAATVFGMLDSVDLVAPPISLDEFRRLVRDLNRGWGARPEPVIRLHLPAARDERRLAVPPYGCSYFELVQRAFQRRSGPAGKPCDFASTSAAPDDLEPKWSAWKRVSRRVRLEPIRWRDDRPPEAPAQLNQIQLLYRSDVGARLRVSLGLDPVPRPAPRAGA
jgi:hypothetical protein